ncbi:MAG: DUF2520 domain-containing protein [Myxococcota bacterium]
MNIVIVGRGKVGRAIEQALAEDGQHALTTMGKRLARVRLEAADVVVLAVPDGAIEAVADAVAPSLKKGSIVVHCAGARDTTPLVACARVGARVSVMHPMVSFASARNPPTLQGKTFVVRGDAGAFPAIREIARACGAEAVRADTTNPIYHASAALAANGAAALAFFAVGLLTRIGLSKRQAEHAVGGIVESVGSNVRTVGVPQALTGPVARGDVDTVERHRKGLRRAPKGPRSVYDAILPAIISTAEAAKLPRRHAKALRALLSQRED